MKLDPEDVFDIGTCTDCGAENVERFCVCDDVYVCADCLDSNFTRCEECGEYYENDVVSEVDGQMLCEYCAEAMGDDDAECDEE